MENTYSIPAFSVLLLGVKSLAVSTRRFNQRFLSNHGMVYGENQTGTHGSMGGQLTNEWSAACPIIVTIALLNQVLIEDESLFIDLLIDKNEPTAHQHFCAVGWFYQADNYAGAGHRLFNL